MEDNKLINYITDYGMPLLPFLDLAVVLADMLNREHQELPYIGYLNPDSIFIQVDEKKAYWIHTTISYDAYRSPEHFGRINITPDGRSDLYGLGVILYELLTGQLPYIVQTTAEWEIAHLSYQPVAISELRSDCPPVIEEILLKLLAKNVENRYQSANSLLHDLNTYQGIYLTKPTSSINLQLGQLDKRKTLPMLDSAHQWINEYKVLADALDQIEPESGRMLLVTGAQGSGKTTLVQQFLKPTKEKFVVIEEYCGDHSLSPPFQSILNVLHQCFQRLWSESPERFKQMKDYIEQQLPNWNTVYSLLTELNILFPDHTAIPSAPSVEEIESALLTLVQGFSKIMGPLIIFIDRIEQSDPQSRQLLQTLNQKQHLMKNGLCIVTCTNKETLIPDHDELQPPAYEITLMSLDYKEVFMYLSRLLEEGSSRIHWLARILYEQTRGNLQQLSTQMRRWLEHHQLKYDDHNARWTWSDELMPLENQLDIDEDQLRTEFSQLSDHTQQFLMFAASLGTFFDVNILIHLTDDSSALLQDLIREAESAGFIAQTQYNLSISSQKYHFIHSQIRQTIYTLEPEQQAVRHLKLALWLEQQIDSESPRFYEEVINHWNLADPCLLISQKEQLAIYNYQASQFWFDHKEFQKSGEYAEKVIQFISKNKDSPAHSLFFQTQLTLARSLYMCSQIEKTETILIHLLKDSDKFSVTERTQVFSFLIQIYAFTDNNRAIEYGMQALSAYHWNIRKKPSQLAVVQEIIRTQIILYKKKDYFTSLPLNHEPEYMDLCTIIEQISLPLLMEDGESLMYLYARFIRYGLQKGLNESFIQLIATFELLLQRSLSQYAHLFGTDYLKSVRHLYLASPHLKHRSDYWQALAYQLNLPEQTSEYLEHALRRSLEIGDTNFSNFVWVSIIITNTGNAHKLTSYIQLFQKHLQHMSSAVALQIYEISQGYLKALKHVSLDSSFITDGLSSKHQLLRHEYNNYESMCKMEIAYLAEQYDIALIWAKQTRKSEFVYDWICVRKHRIYEILVLIAHHEQAGHNHHKQIRQALRKRLRHIRKWRGIFGAQSAAHELLRAEWSKLHHQPNEAINQYKLAAQKARIEHHDWLEGIIYERLALCYEEDPRNQLLTVMDACTAYSNWGVDFKVTQLQNKYDALIRQAKQHWENNALGSDIWIHAAPAASSTVSQETEDDGARESVPSSVLSHTNDEQSILGQIVIESAHSLQENMMQNLLEQAMRQAGADHGQLLAWQEAQPQIMAVPSWRASCTEFPKKILRYVATTREMLILPDANQSHFVTDMYIQTYTPHSILCMPVTLPGFPDTLILYLENRHISNVFTERDIHIIELLVSRTAYLKMLEQEPETAASVASLDMKVIPRPSQILIEPLTDRELEILYAISEGLSNKGIAERLGIAETTVKTHATRIFSKLEVKRRGQAVARAKELKLIDF